MTTLTLRWNGTVAQSPRRSRALMGVLWTLQILSAAMFLFAGSLKLTGAPEMVQTFGAIGLGQWFRYVTGGIEVVSAVLLLIPATAAYGAAALAVTMGGRDHCARVHPWRESGDSDRLAWRDGSDRVGPWDRVGDWTHNAVVADFLVSY
jgi:hypothetical protein